MSERRKVRIALVSVCLAIASVAGEPSSQVVAGQSRTRPLPSAQNGDWVHYASDIRGTRYLPLDQITAANSNRLEVAWRFSTANLGPRPEFNLQGTPLVVGGTLYATGGGGNRRSIVALDARTGELVWKHGIDEGARADAAPRKQSGRGLSYWTDGRGDERIISTSGKKRCSRLPSRATSRECWARCRSATRSAGPTGRVAATIPRRASSSSWRATPASARTRCSIAPILATGCSSPASRAALQAPVVVV
jgi:glucose dehydrogenase